MQKCAYIFADVSHQKNIKKLAYYHFNITAYFSLLNILISIFLPISNTLRKLIHTSISKYALFLNRCEENKREKKNKIKNTHR